MKMTKTLANTLMDCLACLAISANGNRVDLDKKGDSIASDEVATYVRETFLKLAKEWEETMNDKWEITEE